MISRARKGLMAIVILLLTAAGTPLGAQSAAPAHGAEESKSEREYLIKAAFLYNFAKFTEWPTASFPDTASPLNICIVGENPLGEALASITGKKIRGHAVAVRQIEADEAGGACHLLFISESEETRLTAILETLGNQPVLTIADMPDFARAGGIINLKTSKEDKVRFEINVDTAQRAGLKLSSKLLSLAEITSN